MQEFIVCVFSKSDTMGKIYTSIPDFCQFSGVLAAFFAKKKRLNECDRRLQRLFTEGTVVPNASFKNTMRLLRRYDEVGLCNDIYDAIEMINDDGNALAIAFGKRWVGVSFSAVDASDWLIFEQNL